MTQTEASRALYPGWDYVAVFATWLWPKTCCHGVWERVGGSNTETTSVTLWWKGTGDRAPLGTVSCYLFFTWRVRLLVKGIRCVYLESPPSPANTLPGIPVLGQVHLFPPSFPEPSGPHS